MTFKWYMVCLDFWIKNKSNTDVDPDELYSTLDEFIEENGRIPFVEFHTYGDVIEFEDGHIMTFDNLIEN